MLLTGQGCRNEHRDTGLALVDLRSSWKDKYTLIIEIKGVLRVIKKQLPNYFDWNGESGLVGRSDAPTGLCSEKALGAPSCLLHLPKSLPETLAVFSSLRLLSFCDTLLLTPSLQWSPS
jgi:hypothetical protein